MMELSDNCFQQPITAGNVSWLFKEFGDGLSTISLFNTKLAIIMLFGKEYSVRQLCSLVSEGKSQEELQDISFKGLKLDQFQLVVSRIGSQSISRHNYLFDRFDRLGLGFITFEDFDRVFSSMMPNYAKDKYRLRSIFNCADSYGIQKITKLQFIEILESFGI